MIEKIWELLTTLTEETQNAIRKKCIELEYDVNRGEVSLDESFLNLNSLKLVLSDAIEKKKLMQLPITVQRVILQNLESISKSQKNLIAGVDEVVNLVNAIEKLNASIWQYGLNNLSEEVLGYQTKINQLKNQELELEKLNREIEAGLGLKANLEQLFGEASKTMEAIKKYSAAADTNVIEITKKMGQASDTAKVATDNLSSLMQSKKTVEELASSVEITKGKCDAWSKVIGQLSERSEEIGKTLTDRQGVLGDLIDKTEKTYKKVEDLLPGATSAGLASAYRGRKEDIKKSKKFWITGFIASLVVLLGMVIWMIKMFPSHQGVTWWEYLLQRAPLTFPLIWLGWFFSRNYGHAVRLEEDYAFKEAISQSFEGYKEQMSDVSPEKGLQQLCENVIKILSASPLRVFDRKTSDETPANSMLERVFPHKKDKSSIGDKQE